MTAVCGAASSCHPPLEPAGSLLRQLRPPLHDCNTGVAAEQAVRVARLAWRWRRRRRRPAADRPGGRLPCRRVTDCRLYAIARSVSGTELAAGEQPAGLGRQGPAGCRDRVPTIPRFRDDDTRLQGATLMADRRPGTVHCLGLPPARNAALCLSLGSRPHSYGSVPPAHVQQCVNLTAPPPTQALPLLPSLPIGSAASQQLGAAPWTPPARPPGMPSPPARPPPSSAACSHVSSVWLARGAFLGCRYEAYESLQTVVLLACRAAGMGCRPARGSEPLRVCLPRWRRLTEPADCTLCCVI